ncbi:MAG TPA: hypothetical protein VIF14_08735 [Alphaproteobacteria bacterium]|jgi:hypothetical protein
MPTKAYVGRPAAALEARDCSIRSNVPVRRRHDVNKCKQHRARPRDFDALRQRSTGARRGFFARKCGSRARRRLRAWLPRIHKVQTASDAAPRERAARWPDLAMGRPFFEQKENICQEASGLR